MSSEEWDLVQTPDRCGLSEDGRTYRRSGVAGGGRPGTLLRHRCGRTRELAEQKAWD